VGATVVVVAGAIVVVAGAIVVVAGARDVVVKSCSFLVAGRRRAASLAPFFELK
jgi:hypothetical protein